MQSEFVIYEKSLGKPKKINENSIKMLKIIEKSKKGVQKSQSIAE